MPAIEGSYQHVKSENLDAYFEKMGRIKQKVQLVKQLTNCK